MEQHPRVTWEVWASLAFSSMGLRVARAFTIWGLPGNSQGQRSLVGALAGGFFTTEPHLEGDVGLVLEGLLANHLAADSPTSLAPPTLLSFSRHPSAIFASGDCRPLQES